MYIKWKSQCGEITLKSLNFHLKKIGGISIRLFFGFCLPDCFKRCLVPLSLSLCPCHWFPNKSFWPWGPKFLGKGCDWRLLHSDIFCGQIIGTSFGWIDLRCRSPSCDCATNCSIFGSDKVDVVERRQLSGVFSAELPYQKSWFYCQFNGNTGRPKKF